MSWSRNVSRVGLPVAGVIWLALAGFDFYEGRWFRGLVDMVLAVGAFVGFWYARRSRP